MVLAAEEHFTAMFSASVPEDISSSSSHTAHHISLWTTICGVEEFCCDLQSSRNRALKPLAHEKKEQREKRDWDVLGMPLCSLWCQFCIAARAFHSQQSNTPEQQDIWKVSLK